MNNISQVKSIFGTIFSNPIYENLNQENSKSTVVQSHSGKVSKERIDYLWSKARNYAFLLVKLKKSANDAALLTAKGVDTYEKKIEAKKCNLDSAIMQANSLKKLLSDLIEASMGLTDIFVSFYSFFSYDTGKSFTILIVTTIFLSIFIFLHFFQGYFDDIKLVLEFRKVAKRYFKKLFWLDTITTFPIFLFWADGVALRFFRLLKVNEICLSFLRITNDLLQRINVSCSIQLLITKLFQLMFYIILITHICACIWLSFGLDDDGWGTDDLIDQNNLKTLYTCSLYWVIATFTAVGYGDISATNTWEMLFALLVEMVGVGVFGLLLANVKWFIMQMDIKKGKKEEFTENLEEWLMRLNKAPNNKGLKPEYFWEIFRYFLLYWSSNPQLIHTESEFFSFLPPSLQYKLADILLAPILEKFKSFFKGLNKEFSRKMGLQMAYHEYIVNPRDLSTYTILKKDEKLRYVYFILDGTVGIYSKRGVNKMLDLSAGSYFGEAQLIYDIPSKYTFKVSENTRYLRVLRIKRKVFIELLREFPDVFEALKEKASIRLSTIDRVKDFNDKKIANRRNENMIKLNHPNILPPQLQSKGNNERLATETETLQTLPNELISPSNQLMSEERNLLKPSQNVEEHPQINAVKSTSLNPLKAINKIISNSSKPPIPKKEEPKPTESQMKLELETMVRVRKNKKKKSTKNKERFMTIFDVFEKEHLSFSKTLYSEKQICIEGMDDIEEKFKAVIEHTNNTMNTLEDKIKRIALIVNLKSKKSNQEV